MLGLVFAFEDDPEHEPVLADQLPARRVRDAISQAVKGVHGISFEEITFSADPMPKFALIFNDLGLVDSFTARLTLALLPTGIKLSSVRAIKRKEASGEDVAA